MDKSTLGDAQLYLLTTGQPITSLSPFTSPTDEYAAAFKDGTIPFLNFYSFQGQQIEKRTFTRGEFWELARSAAVQLGNRGIFKGSCIAHCFSSNNPYDLMFRLAANCVGGVPVTVNWESDNDETIIYKVNKTGAKLVLYDEGFADRLKQISPMLPTVSFLKAEDIERFPPAGQFTYPPVSYDDEKMIVFTSGTTGKPKGVSQPHRGYLSNRLTFESYFGMSETTRLDLLLVNPMHHTNSSALSDWGLRRPGTVIHLLSRYTTAYWKILVDVARQKRDLLVNSLVSRHFDFLESLAAESKLPVKESELKEALGKTDILIGSAPVGPTTIKRILKFSNRLPHVRFGSTETCLEVMATPTPMSTNKLIEAFNAGWAHRYKDADSAGYYIGREHFPFTRVKIVKGIDPGNDYLRPCEVGEPGYMITQGPNVMSGYVDEPKATRAVLQSGWYTGLRDIGFTLKNKSDGQLDYYWMSRDSALLIRGGANYAYDQVSIELTQFVTENFKLSPQDFKLAVVGLRVTSEHEDSCCVTIELNENAAEAKTALAADFLPKASTMVSKGARPNYLRFGTIPRSFKGEILYPQLKEDCSRWLGVT
ncbi:MAG: class I adenylate-forming enzyme family protein [Chloroflexota bacterium]